MSAPQSASSPIGFGIIDFFTRVVPGSVIVLAVLMISSPQALQLNLSTVEVLVFGLLAFLAGESVNFGRLLFYPVPRAFTRLLFEQSEGYTQMSRADRLREWLPFVSKKIPELHTETQDGFWDRICSDFNVDSFKRIKDIYFIFLQNIEPKFSRRSSRLQAIYHLSVNMAFAGMTAIVLALYALAVPNDSTSVPGAILVLFILFSIIIPVGLYAFGIIEERYVEDLLLVYYAESFADTSW